MSGDAPPDPPGAGGRARAVPIDLIALFAIAAGIVVTHVPYLRGGMCWNEPSALFHYGHRTASGDTPYVDFVFHGGPLPVYVDAAFQLVLGASYRASLAATLVVKLARVLVVWLLARRLAGARPAAALAVFCALDPMFAHLHPDAGAYEQLFVELAGLGLVAAHADGSGGRRELRLLSLAGLAMALVASARPATGLTLGAALLVLTAVFLRRGVYVTRPRFAALWLGYAAGLALIAVALAVAGALGAALSQTLADPARGDAFGLESAMDAWLGGAAVDFTLAPWEALLEAFALPAAAVAGVLCLLARDREVSPRLVAALGCAAGIAYGMHTRYASLNPFSDLPRLLLLAAVALAVLSPERARRWLGVPPLVIVALAALPLAVDRTYPGAGWSDAPGHAIGAVLLALASVRLSARAKLLACAVLALAAAAHFLVIRRTYNPFAHPLARDGRADQHRSAARIEGRRHPLLLGSRFTPARANALGWLADEVPAGSTCFIHGDLPALYTLLGCRNPTRLDTTAARLATDRDAAEASRALAATPPQHLLVNVRQLLHPGLAIDLSRYRAVATTGEAIGPELAAQAGDPGDELLSIRVYHLAAPR